jgi:hypothetical protein
MAFALGHEHFPVLARAGQGRRRLFHAARREGASAAGNRVNDDGDHAARLVSGGIAGVGALETQVYFSVSR